MIIDLNGFKAVNDTLGHHVGDDLLRQVALRFAESAPRGVTVARLGGDEFAVLVSSHPHPCPAVGVAELLARVSLRAVRPRRGAHPSLRVGQASPSHRRGRLVSDLLKRADIAMYAAKNGANSCVLYRPDIDLHDPSLLSLMGLSCGRRSRRARSTSRSSRWSTSRQASIFSPRPWSAGTTRSAGRLRPGLFLPLAERNGLIVPLTTLVLDRAVAACASWRKAGLDIPISVNLSARSLLDTMLPQTVADALERWDLPSDRLTLEITESAVLSDADRALAPLDDLRPRRTPLAGRLRHRLLVALPPAALPICR